jgi:hypothetical protein
MMSICVHHLSYNEKILQDDILNSFTLQHGSPPDTVVGNAKSTESGLLYGFLFKYMKRFQKSGIFIRPQVELSLGFNNSYQGSTQDQPVSDDINQNTGIHFKIIDTVKNNIFLNTEFDMGYSSTNSHLPFALYSGLRLALWLRDMPSNEAFANNESYYRWSVPVGLIINKPVSNCWSLGCDLTFDLMFSGGMDAVMGTENNGNEDEIEIEIGIPEVSLSNRCGYRLELCADGLITERVSLHFAPYLNYYRFGKSNSGYPPINENAATRIPAECTTIMAGMNITFTILMSRN